MHQQTRHSNDRRGTIFLSCSLIFSIKRWGKRQTSKEENPLHLLIHLLYQTCLASKGKHSSDSHDTQGKQVQPQRAWQKAQTLQKFEEGKKSFTFFSCDKAYGNTTKILSFIYHFDAAWKMTTLQVFQAASRHVSPKLGMPMVGES